MSLSLSPEPVNMFGNLNPLLACSLSADLHILDYPGGPSMIPRVKWQKEVEESVRGRRDPDRKAQTDARLLALQMEEGAMSQAMWGPPEAGKGEEADSSIGLPALLTHSS